jgi:hypothetical protein
VTTGGPGAACAWGGTACRDASRAQVSALAGGRVGRLIQISVGGYRVAAATRWLCKAERAQARAQGINMLRATWKA